MNKIKLMGTAKLNEIYKEETFTHLLEKFFRPSERSIIAKFVYKQFAIGESFIEDLWKNYSLSVQTSDSSQYMTQIDNIREMTLDTETYNCSKECEKFGKDLTILLLLIMKTFTNMTAGLLLANFRNLLGNFYSHSQTWPETENGRSQIEEKINKLLIKFTATLSNGQLKDISLLDLPSFGASEVRNDYWYIDHWENQIKYGFEQKVKKYNPNSEMWAMDVYVQNLELYNAWKKYQV